MTTQELKNKIEKVLGNSIRCLLPSYWWKNIFHSVADRIDEVETAVTKNVSDMVVKSIKEFEAKHPEMASNTLILTEDETSAEARSNAIKIMLWAGKLANAPAKAALAPLYIAVPIVGEESGYIIQSPMYGVGNLGLIFYDVRVFDGPNYNIGFDLNSGVATLQEVKDTDIITFIMPIGEQTAEAKQQNKESYTKVYEAFDDAVANGTVTFDVKVNGGIAIFDAIAVVYPIINKQLVISFVDAGGVKQKLIVTEDGTTTMEELFSKSDLSIEVVAIAPDYRELDDDEKDINHESYLRIVGSNGRIDTKVFYRISSTESLAYTVTSVEERDSTLILKAADAEKIFLLSNDGNVTIEDIAPPENFEIRRLRVGSGLSDEAKAYNIETVQKYKEGKVLVVAADQQSGDDDNIAVSRMVAPFFIDIFSEGSNELAAFSFVVLQSGNVDTIADNGQMVVVTVIVYSDGHTQVAGGGLYDAEMSDTSTLAVQNKVIKAYVDGLVALLATKDEQAESEEVAAAALVDLEGRKADREEVVKAIAELNVPALATKDELTEAEEVAAAALVDLDNRLKEIVSQINI